MLHVEGEMMGQMLQHEARDSGFYGWSIMATHAKLYGAVGRIKELFPVTITMEGFYTTTAIIVMVPLGKWTLLHLTARMARQVPLCWGEDDDPCVRDVMIGPTKLHTGASVWN